MTRPLVWEDSRDGLELSAELSQYVSAHAAREQSPDAPDWDGIGYALSLGCVRGELRAGWSDARRTQRARLRDAQRWGDWSYALGYVAGCLVRQ